jgi:hypothetical protein
MATTQPEKMSELSFSKVAGLAVSVLAALAIVCGTVLAAVGQLEVGAWLDLVKWAVGLAAGTGTVLAGSYQWARASKKKADAGANAKAIAAHLGPEPKDPSPR